MRRCCRGRREDARSQTPARDPRVQRGGVVPLDRDQRRQRPARPLKAPDAAYGHRPGHARGEASTRGPRHPQPRRTVSFQGQLRQRNVPPRYRTLTGNTGKPGFGLASLLHEGPPSPLRGCGGQVAMAGTAQLRGMLLEEIVLKFLEGNGYQPILHAGSDPTLDDGPGGIEVVGARHESSGGRDRRPLEVHWHGGHARCTHDPRRGEPRR